MAMINFISLLLLLLASIKLTNAFCYNNTGNFTANSTYANNRKLVLSSLASKSNVTANDGFYTATAGQGNNKVYGLALCRADSSAQACSNCVNFGVQHLAAECPNQKAAISWSGYPSCIVRYANHSFFGILEDSPLQSSANDNNITSVTSNITLFDQIWGGLIDRMITNASKGTSKLKFATGEAEANLIYYKKIYAIMQCTPDLSQGNCSSCLRKLVDAFKSCCHGRQGGYARNGNCLFRWDLYPFYNGSAASSPQPPLVNSSPISKAKKNCASRLVLIIVVPSIIFFMALVVFTCAVLHVRKPKLEVKNVGEHSGEECLQFNFECIKFATNNFSENNMLGKGGFGSVYKGLLPHGREIAVKRLSRNSKQGEVEFKREVLLVARLQHRNLVRLLGFCFEGKERLLIYEFLPNSSLDHFIFDPIKRELLNWEKRYKIIEGIARGILYLHEDSQLRIIHRDLKASNVLLDENMNPKISDFGMAKLFGIDQTQYVTSKIAGTLGYMSPEYAMHGIFSVKSDVFSFGVLILEIITGQKIRCFRGGKDEEDLLTHAWNNWNKGTILSLIDPTLTVASIEDLLTCIHVGLLCVQENGDNRPTMASVVLMLSSSSLALPVPAKPAFFMHSDKEQQTEISIDSYQSDKSKSGTALPSVNEASITELQPR